MNDVITLQPGQPGQGMGYDPLLPLPYGIHVDRETLACRNVPGCPASFQPNDGDYPKLVGFQPTVDPDPEAVLLASDWLDEPELAVGTFAVFIEDGDMFNITVPITGVTRPWQS